MMRSVFIYLVFGWLPLFSQDGDVPTIFLIESLTLGERGAFRVSGSPVDAAKVLGIKPPKPQRVNLRKIATEIDGLRGLEELRFVVDMAWKGCPDTCWFTLQTFQLEKGVELRVRSFGPSADSQAIVLIALDRHFSLRQRWERSDSGEPVSFLTDSGLHRISVTKDRAARIEKLR